MEEEPLPSGALDPNPPPQNSGDGGGGKNIKKAAGPLAVLLAILAKFKGAAIVALKFLPVILKTGGTMILTIGVYAWMWGWRFAVGFVILIFVHECGHLLVAKRLGLKVGAPMFIPFVGAFILLKEMPPNAWAEALVGIGGPFLGAVGSAVCLAIYLTTGDQLFGALAYSGFFINLFNLAPIGFLDGGRIVSALSPWLWLVGLAVVGLMLFYDFNFILLLILIMSLPRLFSLFREKTAEEKRYFEVTPARRWLMGSLYFGLIALLVLGMAVSRVQVDRDRDENRAPQTITYNIPPQTLPVISTNLSS